ncbi:unnamed protein product [Gongylonema pulchrum]|uniref:Ribosomal protein L32 n=1 Tax=Gongylonema pulchrum TaxID=637853 RepID=A0A183E997_9BILA|nr:unnamed protein product [Gongylonema pulchrum]
MGTQQPRKKRASFASLKRDLNLHHFFRPNVSDFSSSATAAAAAAAASHLRPGVTGGQPRRESFLYRPAIDDREFNVPCRSVSRTSSVTSAAAHE